MLGTAAEAGAASFAAAAIAAAAAATARHVVAAAAPGDGRSWLVARSRSDRAAVEPFMAAPGDVDHHPLQGRGHRPHRVPGGGRGHQDPGDVVLGEWTARVRRLVMDPPDASGGSPRACCSARSSSSSLRRGWCRTEARKAAGGGGARWLGLREAGRGGGEATTIGRCPK